MPIPEPFSIATLSASIVANLATDILKHHVQVLEDTRVGGLLKKAGLIEPGFNGRLRDSLCEALDLYFRSHPQYCLTCVVSFLRDPTTAKQIGEFILDQQPIDEAQLQEALDRVIGNDPVARILVKQRHLEPNRIIHDFLEGYRRVLSAQLNAPDLAVLLGLLSQTDRIVAEIRSSERRTKEHLEQALHNTIDADPRPPERKGTSRSSLTLEDLLQACKLQVQNEIESTIGGKYSPALYVDRMARGDIERFLAKKPADAVHLVQQTIRVLDSYLDSIRGGQAEIKQRTVPTDPHRPPRELTTSQKRRIEQLEAEYEEVSSLRPSLENLLTLLKARNPVMSEVRAALDSVIAHTGCIGEIRTIVARIHQTLRNCLLITDAAGRGKTNLACALAMQRVAIQPTVIIAAGTLRLDDVFGLERYLQASLGILSDTTVKYFMHLLMALLEEMDTEILVIVDAINENKDTGLLKAAIQALISRNNDKHFKLVVTCRDIYWNGFLHARGDFWDEYLWQRMELGDFTEEELAQVLPLYFHRFGISAHLSTEAKAKLRHPLLLRFFCEAYHEKGSLVHLGDVEDIRLKHLFDTYWINKVESVRDKLRYRVSHPIEDFLLHVARKMRFNRDRMLSFEDITRISGERDFTTPEAIYTRVLDEGIILEQTPSSVWHESRVTFVYDEFMEYVIARELATWVLNTSNVKTFEIRLRRVLKAARRFSSIYGVISYLLPILDKEGKTGGWNLVYSQGDSWHVSLCRALLKTLPAQPTNEALLVAYQLSRSKDDEVRRQILRLCQDLEVIRADQAIPLYLSLLEDRLPEIYLEARDSLVSLSLSGHSQAREEFQRLLAHRSSRYRGLAAYALTAIGELTVAQIEGLLGDQNSFVREAGIYALGVLHRDLPPAFLANGLRKAYNDRAVKVRAMASWIRIEISQGRM